MYKKLKGLFESKYPQGEERKKPIPDNERLGLESRFFEIKLNKNNEH